MMGGSFGGYMANWIAGHTDRFRAIVSHAGLWALDQMFGTTDAPAYWRPQLRHPPASPSATWPTRRTCTRPQISTPMLVIHGDKDYRVPVGEALRLWCGPVQRPGQGRPSSCTSRTRTTGSSSPAHATVWYETVLRLPGPARARRAVAAPGAALTQSRRACDCTGGVPGWAA